MPPPGGTDIVYDSDLKLEFYLRQYTCVFLSYPRIVNPELFRCITISGQVDRFCQCIYALTIVLIDFLRGYVGNLSLICPQRRTDIRSYAMAYKIHEVVLPHTVVVEHEVMLNADGEMTLSTYLEVPGQDPSTVEVSISSLFDFVVEWYEEDSDARTLFIMVDALSREVEKLRRAAYEADRKSFDFDDIDQDYDEA